MGTWVISAWREYRWCIYIFLIWKIVTVSLIYLSYGLYHIDSYDYLNLRFYLTGPLLPFAFWDGQHYLILAEQGYQNGPPMSLAFYPLFPFTIRIIHLLVPNVILSGIIAATLFSLMFVISFYRLALLFMEPGRAQRAVILTLLFPTSIYLTVIYAEGLFLFLLCVLIFLYLKRNPWCILPALLLPLTRGQGLFLIPAAIAMIIYRMLSHRTEKNITLDLQVLGGFFTGFLLLIFISWHTSGDPLVIFHAQSQFYSFFGISLKNILNPLHILSVMSKITNKWLIPDIILIYIMFIGTFFVLRLKDPMILFSYIALIYLPAAMGTGWSYIRHALLGIPFIYIGLLKIIGLQKWPYVLLGLTSIILQLLVIFCWSAKLFIA